MIFFLLHFLLQPYYRFINYSISFSFHKNREKKGSDFWTQVNMLSWAFGKLGAGMPWGDNKLPFCPSGFQAPKESSRDSQHPFLIISTSPGIFTKVFFKYFDKDLNLLECIAFLPFFVYMPVLCWTDWQPSITVIKVIKASLKET